MCDCRPRCPAFAFVCTHRNEWVQVMCGIEGSRGSEICTKRINGVQIQCRMQETKNEKTNERTKNGQCTQSMSWILSQSRHTCDRVATDTANIESINLLDEIEMPDERKYIFTCTMRIFAIEPRDWITVNMTMARAIVRQQPTSSPLALFFGHFQTVNSAANLSFYWWSRLHLASTRASLGPCGMRLHMCSCTK